MNDILVPAEPADLIDRIVTLQLHIEAAGNRPHTLIRKRDLLTRLAARVLPDDDTATQLTRSLLDARRDLDQLVADLRACDARNDHGTGFVALSQGLLGVLDTISTTRAAINAHAADHAPGRQSTASNSGLRH